MKQLEESGARKKNRRVCMLIIMLSMFGLGGCSTVNYQNHPELTGHTETGTASYYAMKYQFRKTASGERLNQAALTAAHRTLPFGTRVQVTNVKNSRSVIVKINDRGPFIEGRIIDLTRYAFSEIGSIDAGLLPVRIVVIE